MPIGIVGVNSITLFAMLNLDTLKLLPEIIHFRDLDLQVVWATALACEYYGWSLPEREVSNQDFVTRPAAYALENGKWAGVITTEMSDGTESRRISRWTLLKDEQGAILGYFVVERDVSTMQITDQSILNAQRMESIATLAGGVAHDMNNVLGPILMGAEMIRRKVNDPWIEKKLESIEHSARRGADIIKQVLDFSRGTRGEHIEVQVRHVLKELIQFSERLLTKAISLEGLLPRDLPTIMGEASQIRQAVLNLIVNAGEAMPGGGTITVCADPVSLTADEAIRISPAGTAGHFVRIMVKDTGNGIPEDQIDRVFDPFFSTKSRGQGTGLGLSTTLSIVNGHGGFATVTSESGKGSSFSLFFPQAIQPTSFPASSASSAPRTQAEGQAILIVDDEPMMLEMNADMLTSLGYTTLTASNGQEGLDQFLAGSGLISLVITDINMPVMDGPTMIQEIRKSRPEIPIIVVSGLSKKEHHRDGTGLDDLEILRKPYSTDQLLALVESNIGSTPPAKTAPDSYSSSGFEPMSDDAFDRLMGGDW